MMIQRAKREAPAADRSNKSLPLIRQPNTKNKKPGSQTQAPYNRQPMKLFGGVVTP